jgi:hypothetical protein
MHINHTKMRWWARVLRMGKQFLLEAWHLSYYSYYTFGDFVMNGDFYHRKSMENWEVILYLLIFEITKLVLNMQRTCHYSNTLPTMDNGQAFCIITLQPSDYSRTDLNCSVKIMCHQDTAKFEAPAKYHYFGFLELVGFQ